MTIKKLLKNRRFMYWVDLEYGDSEALTEDTDFDFLKRLMYEWLSTPKLFKFASDKDRKDRILTK